MADRPPVHTASALTASQIRKFMLAKETYFKRLEKQQRKIRDDKKKGLAGFLE